jgi:hypothetical protein
VAVVDKAVRAGVLAEEECGVDGGTEAEELTPWAVDQLMRGGVADLAEPEAGGEEEEHFLAPVEAAVASDGPDHDRQRGEDAHGDRDEEEVGGGKLAPSVAPAVRGTSWSRRMVRTPM